MKDKTDKELMILVADRNSLALKTLYQRFHVHIFNFIRRYTGNRELAQDLLQETFTRIWFAAHTFDQKKGNFKSWLFTIALNITRSEMSKKRYEFFCAEISQLSPEKGKMTLIETEQPDKKYEKHDSISYVLNQLKPFLREIVILKIYHQLKFTEISEITQTPVGTLKARFHRAIEQMRELFDNELINY